MMMPVTLRRLLTGVTATIRNPNVHLLPRPPLPYRHVHPHPSFPSSHPSLYLNHRLLSSSPTENPIPLNPLRTRTPLEKHFETWVQKLKPGFGPLEVNEALKAQSDADLALDIFRWTAQQRNYKHNHATYLTMIRILLDGRRYRHAETLVEEVIAGACEICVPLYNSMIGFCCGRKLLFNRAFDIYKKMLNSENYKPNLETYALLLNSLLRRFNNMHVCYVYLRAVRSLSKQMKACGVIPDTFVLNMIIKAYSKCLQVDDAMQVFREMGLYGCEPNAYTYGYIAKGLCEKGRVAKGLGFYKEMRGKGLVPSSSTYVIVICSLAMGQKYDDATEVVLDMLSNAMSPDLLTYKTLLEGLCRDGKGVEAFDLLEDFRRKDSMMNGRTYKTLLNALHFVNGE
ncbi:pentatricopeptide repeat-containing protein [Pyrus ussuriensis x Pyrus communis]|uniref:Pentatricopeptide repeat-containing protein n=1 Tax=Pyrus ussuriensis x Pyrus communis TaxID=2448454 RepID=A0A5N5FLV8_9ROSA|nr:pentatricopeptide repeat-containing protein [Pyrus ussuriensis x Pyrus communis]